MIGSTTLHYKIIEKLGEGITGIINKACNVSLNLIAALKDYKKFLEIWKDADFHSPEITNAIFQISIEGSTKK